MRIAYLTSRYPAVSHTFIRREVQALRARGLDVETFTLRRADDHEVLSPEDRDERARTHALQPFRLASVVKAHVRALVSRPERYLDTLRLALRHRMPGARNVVWSLFHFGEAIVLADQLERHGVDHLHTHFSNAGGDVGLLASRFRGIGWSLTLHGSADFDAPTKPLLGEKIAATVFTACVSHHGRAQALRSAAPQVWDRVTVVRCGIQLDRFSYRPRPASARPRILNVGRLSPEKGQVVLIDAFALLIQRGLDAQLRIVGEGPERPRLEEAIRRHGLQDRVVLAGALPEDRVAEELAAADLFALTSFMEGLPVVLMEAMATGLPVVAPRLSGVPELVEDGETGLLFTPAHTAELADRLERLIREPQTASALAARARGKIEREFDIQQATAPLIDRFRALAKESP